MEWEFPDADVDIRQGDMLVARNVQNHNPLYICVVITADCDISNKKFGRALACLPVMFHDDYIRTIWAEGRLLKLRVDTIKKARDQIAKWHKIRTGEDTQFSEEAIESWLLRAGAEGVVQELEIPEESRSKVIRSLAPAASALSVAVRDDEMFPIVRCAEVRAASFCETQVDAMAKLLEEARKHCKELPEDIFLLPEIPGFGERSALVMLRELYPVPIERIFTRISEADDTAALIAAEGRSNEVVYARLGRLAPTFKYALSQMFGTLYSRIGLPREFELKRDSAVARVPSYRWS